MTDARAPAFAFAEAGATPVHRTTQHFNETARSLYGRIGTVTPLIKYNRY